MDPIVIAKLVANELPGLATQIAIIVFSGIAAAGGAYFGKYLQTKGQNWATKEDFAMLQQQLMASTKLVESIKSEFGKADWIDKEWTTLRIRKIEELMDGVHAVEGVVRQFKTEQGMQDISQTAVIFAVPMKIAAIYLPDFAKIVERYCQLAHMRLMLLEQSSDPSWLGGNNRAEETVTELRRYKQELQTIKLETDQVYIELRDSVSQMLHALVRHPRGAQLPQDTSGAGAAP